LSKAAVAEDSKSEQQYECEKLVSFRNHLVLLATSLTDRIDLTRVYA
jgi:hypothetical protein